MKTVSPPQKLMHCTCADVMAMFCCELYTYHCALQLQFGNVSACFARWNLSPRHANVRCHVLEEMLSWYHLSAGKHHCKYRSALIKLVFNLIIVSFMLLYAWRSQQLRTYEQCHATALTSRLVLITLISERCLKCK